MTTGAVIAERRVIARNRSGVEKLLVAVDSKKYDTCDSASNGEETDPATGATPGMFLVVITEIAFVALGNLLLGSTRRGHGRRSVIKKGHERVPRRQHQEQKRKRHVHKQPSMQPVVQLGLPIEHAALVAPRLDFFHPAAIRFGHAQFCITESVVRKAGIVELEPFAAACAEIRKNLPLDKLNQRRF